MTEDTAVEEVVIGADDLIPMPQSIVTAAVGCALFVQDCISAATNGDALGPKDFFAIAEHHGLTTLRAPTGEELGDPNWWGHKVGITEGDERVTAYDPNFAALLDSISSVDFGDEPAAEEKIEEAAQ